MNTARIPPASLLLVHGAGSGPWVYKDWAESFPNIAINAVDLQDGLDVTCASMKDYADRVGIAAEQMPQPLALVGWSMGGLVVMQAAQRLRLHSVILLEPSAPAEIQGTHLDVELTKGAFDPESTYGSFPSGMPARLESSLARRERKRGISIPILPCAALVIYGDEFRTERGEAIARLYGAQEHFFPGLNHWDLVVNPTVRQVISAFLGISRAAS